ncbi:MAG: hypothetical protein H0T12_04970 [Actinobacteria bacterium]|nr:hypothetical protein [Actinomycetota bacterium]
MVEELRFFLRIAIYLVVIGTIYWFVSYEVAGTVLLLSGAIGTGFFVVAARVSFQPKTPEDLIPRPPRTGLKRMAGVFGRYFAFDGEHDPGGEPAEAPLALAEEGFPESSIWPLAAALATLLLGLGVVFGPWLWIPGVVLGASSLWGWLTQLTA